MERGTGARHVLQILASLSTLAVSLYALPLVFYSGLRSCLIVLCFDSHEEKGEATGFGTAFYGI